MCINNFKEIRAIRVDCLLNDFQFCQILQLFLYKNKIQDNFKKLYINHY